MERVNSFEIVLCAWGEVGSSFIFFHMNTTAGFPGGSAGKESTYNVGELGSIPGLGRSLVERTSCPLQYSGLENSMDCIIHGITKSHTQPSDTHFHLFSIINSNKFHVPWPVVLPLSNIKYLYVVDMILGSLVCSTGLSLSTPTSSCLSYYITKKKKKFDI